MIKILQDGIGWVTVNYSDGSKRIVRTTLNQEFLASMGINDLGENIYDLDKQEFVELVGSVTITKERPELDEFNSIVNRYL